MKGCRITDDKERLQMKENLELERNDLVINPDMEVDGGTKQILAYIETWFDVDAKFGTHTAEKDEWVNLYARYQPQNGALAMGYFVEWDGGVQAFSYAPTEAEKRLIVEMMEECCQAHYQCALAEYADGLPGICLEARPGGDL